MVKRCGLILKVTIFFSTATEYDEIFRGILDSNLITTFFFPRHNYDGEVKNGSEW